MPTNSTLRPRVRERPARYGSPPPPPKASTPSETNDSPENEPMDTGEEESEHRSPEHVGMTMTTPGDATQWQPEDFTAIAAAMHEAGTLRAPKLRGSDENLPAQLSSKRASDVSRVVETLLCALRESDLSFAPEAGVDTFLAMLASESTHVAACNKQRAQQAAKLRTSQRQRESTERTKAALQRDVARLTSQSDKERLRRTRALDRTAAQEKKRDAARAKLRVECARVDDMHTALEKAKRKDLEMRRRLDRIRLKVGALRGQMIVPTVGELAVEELQQHVHGSEDMERAFAVHPTFAKYATGRVPNRYSYWQYSPSTSSASSIPSDSDSYGIGGGGGGGGVGVGGGGGDGLDGEEDAVGIEIHLLKNRLNMLTAEADEWNATLKAERKQSEYVLRSKVQLEDELAKAKAGGSGKPSGALGGGRGGVKTDQRSHSKIRASVRGSISLRPVELSPRKHIRKGRKSKAPVRALAPDV